MVLDVLLIVLALLAVVIGYKIGFLRFVLHLASAFTGLIISVVLAKPVSTFIGKTPINNLVYNLVFNRLETSDIFVALGDEASIVEMLRALGLSKTFATMLEPFVISLGVSNENLLESMSLHLSSLMVLIFTFFFLWIGLGLLLWVLKIFAEMLREIKLIKVVDGIVGIAFSISLLIVITYTVVAGGYYLRKVQFIENKIGEFMTEQQETSLGLYSYFEEHNFIINFIELLNEEETNEN